jgi:hypothetical protein
MSHEDERQDERRALSRRGFLKRATAVGLSSVAARGVYEVLHEVGRGPQRAEAAPVIRFQEQYLIDQIEVVENALAKVEAPYPSTAAGLTIVTGWGLPYFRDFVPALMDAYLPAIPNTSPKQYAVLDTITSPATPPAWCWRATT